MKFIHTADWQLGMKAQSVGEAGKLVRERRLKTAQKVIDAAHEHKVDFILIAGDTFEDNGIERILIQKTADILAKFNGPVFIIPGNHDPLIPGSVWGHPAWKSTNNLHVLREEKPFEIDGGFLYPCPIREKYSRKNPTAWIDAGENDGIKIGVAHGTVEGVHQDEPCYPIPRSAAQNIGLDYLALGHWHSTVTYSGHDDTVRMAYSGTHETTKFGERDSGNILIVEIIEAGAQPVISPVHTGTLVWNIIEEELRTEGDLKKIRENIESLENPHTMLLELNLSGILAAEDRYELERIDEILRARFLYSRLDVSRLLPSPEDENWLANLPLGIIRETADRLRQLADPNFEGTRPEGASPEMASRALVELYAIIGEDSQ